MEILDSELEIIDFLKLKSMPDKSLVINFDNDETLESPQPKIPEK